MREHAFYSHAKLLLTAEYAVLDGAVALALPCKFGQWLYVTPIKDTNTLIWQSYTVENNLWFSSTFAIDAIASNTSAALTTTDSKTSNTLQDILKAALAANPDFLDPKKGYKVSTNLTFARLWGLGTSSTLIHNIAQWACIDAFALLKNSFGGSGYDIACARQKEPLFYRLNQGKPVVDTIVFSPVFKEHLFFVYLNKKQDSKAGISSYKKQVTNSNALVQEISKLTHAIAKADTLEVFERLLNKHEALLSSVLNSPTVKERYFKDYPNTIKSLGAWGGDFVLATGDQKSRAYFLEKGYTTIIDYKDMVW